MKLQPVIICTVSFIFGQIPLSSATPIQWQASNGGNDHWYDWIQTSLNWTDSREHAETQYFEGIQGHLVSITSAEEDDFVQTLFPAETDRIWFGGYQLNNDAEPDGNWAWVTGEDWVYANFLYNNDGLGDHQDFLQWWEGGWDDAWDVAINSNDWPNMGYIVEFESNPVPEPTTALLFGTGLLGLARFMKKTK